ncbi:MAG: 4-alpha-glucanotransferase, partial [Candidatus Binatia bacterium]
RHVDFCCSQPAGVNARIVLESGDALSVTVEEAAPGYGRVHVPPDVPAGYHRIETEDGDHVAQVHVLVAPPCLPPAARGWGLFAPLYALRTGRPQSAEPATYSDLASLAKWMVAAAPRSGSGRNSAFLGTLPLLACFFEKPFEPSPYSPISRAFWSELYIDPRAAAEYDASLPLASAAAGEFTGRIDYRRAMGARRAAIESLLHGLDCRGGARREQFENALVDDPELAQYSAFRACVEHYGTTWQQWPARARDGLLRAGSDYDADVFRYHAYAQWLAREQVGAAAAASPAGLYLDLPLGSHGGGYDTWRHPGDFAHGISVGAPPDMVFEGGQAWGFPPLHPERARTGGYASLRAALRHHFEHAALLRVDHVMGLHRMFWIPDGFTAADGVYVRSRAEELWSILSIEAARARGGAGAAVVGEDLGTVPDEVRAEMGSRGALRMFVVPFECRDDDAHPLGEPAAQAMACLGTHDMEPFASWWDHDATRRNAIAAFVGNRESERSAADVLPALLAWLSASDATIVVANLEDFWLERQRQNLPGTEAADRNWKRPLARTFAEFAEDAEVLRLARITRGQPVPVATPGPAEQAASTHARSSA